LYEEPPIVSKGVKALDFAGSAILRAYTWKRNPRTNAA